MRTREQGFTLIEIMIYMALLSALMVGLWAAVFQYVAHSNSNALKLKQSSDIQYMVEKFQWAGQGASSLVVEPDRVTIQRSDLGSGSPLVFSVAKNNITLQHGGNVPVSLFPLSSIIGPQEGVAPFVYSQSSRILTISVRVNGTDVTRVVVL